MRRFPPPHLFCCSSSESTSGDDWSHKNEGIILGNTLEGLPLLELSTILATSTVGDSSENLLLQINPGDLLRGYVAEVGYSDETGQPTISGFVLDTVSSPFTLYVSLVTSLLLSLGVQRSQGGS
jgi:hypothetical protein